MNNPDHKEHSRFPAMPDFHRRVPRYLWKYQPKPRIVLFARPSEQVEDPTLLLDLGSGSLGRHRVKESLAGTTLVHVLAIVWALSLTTAPHIHGDELLLARHIGDSTQLVAPPPELLRELTRPAAPSEMSLEQLVAPPGPGSPRVAEPPPGPLVEQPKPFVPEAAAPTPAKPKTPLVEPPSIEELGAGPDQPEIELPPDSSPPPPGPPPDSQDSETNPRLAFESVGGGAFSSSGSGSGSGGGGGSGVGQTSPVIKKPTSSVREAVREVVRSGGGGKGLVVGDIEAGAASLRPV